MIETLIFDTIKIIRVTYIGKTDKGVKDKGG